ncbi:MAG: hypothetical protein QM767_24045 [Anaeromyxobacter sp.]
MVSSHHSWMGWPARGVGARSRATTSSRHWPARQSCTCPAVRPEARTATAWRLSRWIQNEACWPEGSGCSTARPGWSCTGLAFSSWNGTAWSAAAPFPATGEASRSL